MNQISPRPTVFRVLRKWKLPPRMEFRLIEDIDRRLWICESCPAGEQFWTIAQATTLTYGSRSNRAVFELVREAVQIAVRERRPAHRNLSVHNNASNYRKSIRLASRITERV